MTGPSPSMSPESSGSEFRMLPLSELRESMRNPRRHFDDQKFKELVESVMPWRIGA